MIIDERMLWDLVMPFVKTADECVSCKQLDLKLRIRMHEAMKNLRLVIRNLRILSFHKLEVLLFWLTPEKATNW